MILTSLVIWGAYTVGVGAMLSSTKKPIRVSQKIHREPIYCFWASGRVDRACSYWGLEETRWEAECVPDPDCTKLPDGTDYIRP